MTYEEKKKEQVPSVAQNTAQPSVKKEDIANKILSRGDFTFDVNEDALYDQYAQQYARMGQQAMTDTMARAQAMTGGYGNSYAQNVGQQAYQEYMRGANDIIPDLYQMALNRYMMEGDQLMTQYNILADREALAREQARYDREWEAQQAAIAEEQRRYDQEWEAQKAAIAEEQRRYDQEWAAAHPEAAGGSGGGGSGGSGGSNSGGGGGHNSLISNNTIGSGMTDNARSFMSTLPYVPAGGNVEGWKNLVSKRLDSSGLSDSEKIAIIYELGLDK